MNSKYNRWTLLDGKEIIIGAGVYTQCKCDCGTLRKVRIKNLKSNQSKSCGCIGGEKTTERNTTHGKSSTKSWRIWQAMKNRCYNKNTAQYSNYGGRGIAICKEWRESFESFFRDVGDCPEGKSIDRIDNDGNYEPNNVKWSSSKEQCQNKSNNRKIKGVCISEISRSLGGGHALVAKRLARGWEEGRAITEKTNANI